MPRPSEEDLKQLKSLTEVKSVNYNPLRGVITITFRPQIIYRINSRTGEPLRSTEGQTPYYMNELTYFFHTTKGYENVSMTQRNAGLTKINNVAYPIMHPHLNCMAMTRREVAAELKQGNYYEATLRMLQFTRVGHYTPGVSLQTAVAAKLPRAATLMRRFKKREKNVRKV